jgi:hypothetical protein
MVYLIAFFNSTKKAITIASPEAITKKSRSLRFRTTIAIAIMVTINKRR